MNRREFGKLIAGTGLAAAIPAQSVMAATAQRSKYIYAVALAHAKTDVSAEMLSEKFGIRPSTARKYISRLVRNGVVDRPNAEGIARLAKPLQRIVPEVVEYNPLGGYSVKGPLEELRKKSIEAVKEHLLDDEAQDRPQEEDTADDPEPALHQA